MMQNKTEQNLDLPVGWVESLISDISCIRRGASPRPIDNPEYFSEKGRGWIRISDLSKIYKYLNRTSQYLSRLGESKSVPVNHGDLIMSICATIGKPALINMSACIHDGFVLFQNIDEWIDTEFLFYKIDYHSDDFRKQNQTGTQGNLNTGIVRNFKLTLPRVKKEQQKIAEILSTVDETIEKTDQLIKKYKRIKQGIMQDLLTRGIDEDGNIRSEETHEFKDSPLGRIPVEWSVVNTTDIVNKSNGSIKIGPFGSQLKKEYFVESGYKVYGQENAFLKNFQIGERYIDKSRFNQLRSCELIPGDFIISMMGTIGKCAIVPKNISKGIMDSHLIRLQINKQKYSKNLLMYLIEEYYPIKQQVINLSVGGIMQGLSSTIIKKLQFPSPKLDEQDRIVNQLKLVDKSITQEYATKNKLLSLKHGLMEDLLTGKVRTNHLLNN